MCLNVSNSKKKKNTIAFSINTSMFCSTVGEQEDKDCSPLLADTRVNLSTASGSFHSGTTGQRTFKRGHQVRAKAFCESPGSEA